MSKNTSIQRRKDDHLDINLTKNVKSMIGTSLEKYVFVHHALPDMDLEFVDPSSSFFGRSLSYPLLISSMTGGTSKSSDINRVLASIAQEFRIAMGVGSQRIGLEQPDSMNYFKVRDTAPDILLFANLGAVQLNYSYTEEHCKRAIDAIEADALILHLNPLQEAVMGDGDTNFFGLLKKIEKVCKNLTVPVVVKEVGWGINTLTAKQLVEVGVQAIDVAGAGGTSWSQVEKYRTDKNLNKMIAEAFQDWGIPTAEALVDLQKAFPAIPVIASGGLKNGVDVAKCIALGAKLAGFAGSFIRAAANSIDELHNYALVITQQFKIAMFCVGAKNLSELDQSKIRKVE